MERLDGTGLNATQDESLAWAQSYLNRIIHTEALAALNVLPEGVCDDQCNRKAKTRFQFGKYELCRWCTVRRLKVANDLVSGKHDQKTYAGGTPDSAYLSMALNWAMTNINDLSPNDMRKRLDKMPLTKEERKWISKRLRAVRAA